MAAVTSRPKGKVSMSSGLNGRPRKTFQSIDTNILSYRRTDPFHAFNVLRKLLAALPSKIGGCQYKLSPEEHKLSIHLMTIIEPFVGPSPSRRTLTRQPNEILDAIVFHIDSKHDLLALALSCHRLHNVIFPRHYNYRLIRCKVSSISVWNHLIVNRSLARNVRRLEILDERSADIGVVPKGILTSDTDLESTDDELGMHAKQERFVVSALHKMVALQSFMWSCNHSPISIDNVWPTLLKSQSLQQIEINDNLVYSTYISAHADVANDTPSSNLRNLKTVVLRSTKHVYGSTKSPSLSRMSKMLSDCPNLEALNIFYDHRRGPGYLYPRADDFFLYSHWPQLRSLSLTNLRCSSVHGLDAVAMFLRSHLNLEVLHLDIGESEVGRPLLTLPSDSLPKLRELRANNSITASILSCPCISPRPLELLKGICVTNATCDERFLTSLKMGGSKIKRLELAGWNEMEDVKQLVRFTPKVTWLDLGKKIGPGRCPRETMSLSPNVTKTATIPINTNVVEWADILSILPDLHTFHGVKFFYKVSPLALTALALSSTHQHSSSSHLPASELSRLRKNESVASVLASRCPKLRRLDSWDDASGKAVMIIREGGDIRLELRRVKI